MFQARIIAFEGGANGPIPWGNIEVLETFGYHIAALRLLRHSVILTKVVGGRVPRRAGRCTAGSPPGSGRGGLSASGFEPACTAQSRPWPARQVVAPRRHPSQTCRNGGHPPQQPQLRRLIR